MSALGAIAQGEGAYSRDRARPAVIRLGTRRFSDAALPHAQAIARQANERCMRTLSREFLI